MCCHKIKNNATYKTLQKSYITLYFVYIKLCNTYCRIYISRYVELQTQYDLTFKKIRIVHVSDPSIVSICIDIICIVSLVLTKIWSRCDAKPPYQYEHEADMLCGSKTILAIVTCHTCVPDC